MVEIFAPQKSNCIVLARQGEAISPQSLSLATALAGVEGLSPSSRAELKAEWAQVLWSMKDIAD